MKFVYHLTMLFTVFFSIHCFAEKEQQKDAVNAIKEMAIEQLDFESLCKKSKIGNLAQCVKDKDEEEVESPFLERIKTQVLLHPYIQEFAYVNGVLCHVASYPQSVIYTVLQGPQYGLQTVVDHQGIILYINYDYTVEYTYIGVILHHYYSDCEVITGSNQVIMFD